MRKSTSALLGLLYIVHAHPSMAQTNQRANIAALWSGWHQCGTSKVGTSVMISVDSMGRLIGIREFYPTPADPARLSGSFRVSGTYQPANGSVTLLAGDWINHPSNYLKCDFIGQVDAAGTVMTGESPGCSQYCGRFELRRQ
jgi:hypothetical protein